MALPKADFIKANGLNFALYQARPAKDYGGEPKGLVLLCHGFPELGYSWRHQLQPLADAGWHAVAPDLRGFGQSDVPEDPTQYAMDSCTKDVAAIINALGYDQAVLVGHDFGGMLVWAVPFFQPQVIRGVASICTPFTPRAKHEPIAMFNHHYGEDNYINRFQQPGFMEEHFNKDISHVFKMMMRRDVGEGTPLGQAGHLDTSMMEWWKKILQDEKEWPGEMFLSDEELQTYTDLYKNAGGFTGGFNWYRNLTRTWELMEQYQPVGGEKPQMAFPTLQMMPDKDPSSPPFLADGMEKFCPDMERVEITDAGHWAQQEQPAQVNAALIDWLGRKF